MMSLIVLYLVVTGVTGASNLDPRRVGVLYTGDPYPGVTPYISMKEDAFVLVTPVQGSREHYAGITWEDIHKSLRVYMPRTYRDYLDNYDVMILSDTNKRIFRDEQHSWMKDGVIDEGMGLLMVGGYESFGAGFGHPHWGGSLVEEILPVTVPVSGDDWVSTDSQRGIFITQAGFENDFIRSLPYEPTPEYLRAGTDGNIVVLKEGATVLARWTSGKYENPPCYVTWDIGQGRTYAMCHDWTPGGGWLMSRWEYYRDYSVNLMLYLADRELSTNHQVVHKYREDIHKLAIGRSTLFALIEFVESFGGNAREIDEEVTALEEIVSDSKEDYLDHEFEVAMGKSEAALDKLKEIEELALRVKDEALFWVYLIEWLSVMGMSMVSGVVLWTLMVRRKLYREVGVTRGAEGPG